MDLLKSIKFSTFLKRQPQTKRNYNKVFCVGWLKTGTTSMGFAIKNLGFVHLSYEQYIWRNWYQNGKIDKLMNYAKHYESFDDLPWNKPEIFQHINKCFPNSKYILTLREPEAWFDSLVRFNKKLNKKTDFNKEAEIQKYIEHNNFYRLNVPKENLLEFDIFKGEKMEKLATFLEVELPSHELKFPHENKT